MEGWTEWLEVNHSIKNTSEALETKGMIGRVMDNLAEREQFGCQVGKAS